MPDLLEESEIAGVDRDIQIPKSNLLAPPTAPVSMPVALLNALREEILSGRLRPLQRLSQDELADRFGVSRMPVREALRLLQSERLVHIAPHRSAVITDISVSELCEIYAIRKLLEGYATEAGAARMQKAELETLEALLGQMEGFSKDGVATPADIHRGFHFTIYDAARMPSLTRLIAELWPASERYRRFYSSLPGRKAMAMDLHRELFRCCTAHDGPAARQVMVEHLASIEENVTQNIRNSIFA